MNDVIVPESEETAPAAAIGSFVAKEPASEEDSALSFGYMQWDGLLPNILQIYPVINRLHRPEPLLSPEAQRVNDGLIRFYEDLFKVVPEELAIYVYLGMAGSVELRWVRFQTDEKSYTFAVRSSDFNRWIDAVVDLKDPNWMISDNDCAEMKERGLEFNVSKLSIELPLSCYQTEFGSHPMDSLYDGDFKVLGGALQRLKDTMMDKLKEATKETNILVNAHCKQDHDLYLVFKAKPGFKHLDVLLEKVAPVFESEEGISLGDQASLPAEWESVSKKATNAVKRIYAQGKQINKAIDAARALISQHPIIQQEFDQWIKTNLFAAGHFTKLVYGFRGEDDPALVNKHANSIIRALTYKGGNIGLDLNSWITWEYEAGKIPTRSKDPEVDFADSLHKKYTESFIQALYNFLIVSGNPYVRPYDYREAADMSDGIAIGSIRIAK